MMTGSSNQVIGEGQIDCGGGSIRRISRRPCGLAAPVPQTMARGVVLSIDLPPQPPGKRGRNRVEGGRIGRRPPSSHTLPVLEDFLFVRLPLTIHPGVNTSFRSPSPVRVWFRKGINRRRPAGGSVRLL